MSCPEGFDAEVYLDEFDLLAELDINHEDMDKSRCKDSG